jgi:acetyl-CoA carboxylase biotin carboxyl carrier protein
LGKKETTLSKSNQSKNRKSSKTSENFKPFPNYEAQGFEAFLQLLNRNQVAEFECEDFRIELGRASTHIAPPTMAQTLSAPMLSASIPTTAAQAIATPSPQPAVPTSTRPANQKVIRSPFVGTFYTSPAPGKPPYVQVGSKVKKGDILCIVEAMKLMNEIESEFQGKVIEIIAQNGRPVEFDEPLMVIEIS